MNRKYQASFYGWESWLWKTRISWKGKRSFEIYNQTWLQDSLIFYVRLLWRDQEVMKTSFYHFWFGWGYLDGEEEFGFEVGWCGGWVINFSFILPTPLSLSSQTLKNHVLRLGFERDNKSSFILLKLFFCRRVLLRVRVRS